MIPWEQDHALPVAREEMARNSNEKFFRLFILPPQFRVGIGMVRLDPKDEITAYDCEGRRLNGRFVLSESAHVSPDGLQQHVTLQLVRWIAMEIGKM